MKQRHLTGRRSRSHGPALGKAAPKWRLRPIFLIAAVLLTAPAAAQSRNCDGGVEQRNVFYRNGDIDLAAEWITPREGEAFPALAIMQGSGSSDRNNGWADQFAQTLARCGIAVLLTDKRGSGLSGGDWRTASMGDLASDGVAALAWLSRQPRVNGARVGIMGLSQGGRVAAEAAARSPEADFVISLVNTSGPMWEAMVREVELAYQEHGLNQAQIDHLRGLTNTGFTYVSTGRGWEDYLRFHQELAAGPMAPATYTWPDYPSHWYWTFWRANYRHDARPFLRRAVTERGMPALAVYGERDTNADPADAVGLRHAVPDSRLRIEVIPGVGHSLRNANGELHPQVLSLILETIERTGTRR